MTSFKVPSEEELDHNYLWRYSKALPERGRVGIFNRSYDQEVLVVRVHPELLERQRLPKIKVDKEFWQARYDDINAFERHLSRNGTLAVKFFLNVSKAEQKERLLERTEDPKKRWKFSAADLEERKCWDAYMKAFEEAINATSTEHAPWYIIPADRKWIARSVVASILGIGHRNAQARVSPFDRRKEQGIGRGAEAAHGRALRLPLGKWQPLRGSSPAGR